MAVAESGYAPRLDSDSISRDSLDFGATDQLLEKSRILPRSQKASRLLIATLVALTALTLSIMSLIMVILHREPSDQLCAARTSVWSPLIEANMIEYRDVRFEAAFTQRSIYTGPPSPEVEAAWRKISLGHGIEILSDKLPLLNESVESGLKRVPEEWRRKSHDLSKPSTAKSEVGYNAGIEVYHQLHCLNLVRQYTWFLTGHYDTPPDGLDSTPVGNRLHVDHCIETLRNALMCSADVTPIFMLENGHTQFDNLHKCRNFEKIDAWMKENWTVL